MAFLAGAFFTAGLKWGCLVFYIGRRAFEHGYQTTIAICTVLMAPVCLPEEQAKVQVEVVLPVLNLKFTTFTWQGWLAERPRRLFGQVLLDLPIVRMIIWPIRESIVFQLGLL
ncbi:hypothetical protein BDR03DRAFT_945724 [Suillus americanus]|nr:hypothetical protein BDR03DRAFT_945724 [Suillus americanus]